MGVKSLKNWWTTIAGLLAGAGNYMSQVGTVPSTWEDAGHFAFSLGLIFLGIVSKDGNTGSSPKK